MVSSAPGQDAAEYSDSGQMFTLRASATKQLVGVSSAAWMVTAGLALLPTSTSYSRDNFVSETNLSSLKDQSDAGKFLHLS